ncbi:hypothetical protein SDC9_157346 [bioreactor metagenome]|uniref:Uncharacterized protein n=1 Tax=bioreactor metagenome TaxID=1076179 RepID=A0A645FCG4_9ZZZZ
MDVVHGEAGRAGQAVVDQGGAGRDPGHPLLLGRVVDPPGLAESPDPPLRLGVDDDRATERGGDGVRGDVVVGRADPP